MRFGEYTKRLKSYRHQKYTAISNKFDIELLTDRVQYFCKEIKSIASCYVKVDILSKKLTIYTVIKEVDFNTETKIFQELYYDLINLFSDYYVDPRIVTLGPDNNQDIPAEFTLIYGSN